DTTCSRGRPSSAVRPPPPRALWTGSRPPRRPAAAPEPSGGLPRVSSWDPSRFEVVRRGPDPPKPVLSLRRYTTPERPSTRHIGVRGHHPVTVRSPLTGKWTLAYGGRVGDVFKA